MIKNIKKILFAITLIVSSFAMEQVKNNEDILYNIFKIFEKRDIDNNLKVLYRKKFIIPYEAKIGLKKPSRKNSKLNNKGDQNNINNIYNDNLDKVVIASYNITPSYTCAVSISIRAC